MAIRPEDYHQISPGVDLGLLAARRMGPATWLTQPDTQTLRGDDPVTKTKQPTEPKQKRQYNRKPKAVEAVGGGDPASTAAASVGQGATKTLLSGLVPAESGASLMVVLDFAGQEDLLSRARAASDDLPRDIFALLRALLDGKLLAKDGSVLAGGGL